MSDETLTEGGPETPTIELTGGGAFGYLPNKSFDALAEIVQSLPTTVKLGAILPRHRPVALCLDSFLDDLKAAALPASVDYYTKAAAALARMYLNDRMGCCVISGKAHSVGVWTANDGEQAAVQATDAEILTAYNRLKAGPGDSGCYINQVLDAMRATGIVFGGAPRKIDGYVAVPNSSRDHVRAAIHLFGAITIGINLPSAWQSSAVWDVTSSRIIGGHDVSVVGYDEQYLYISSWGRTYRMTWRAFTARTWVTECYAMLAPDWYGKDQKAAAVGLDSAGLKSALAKLGQGQIPDVDPVPVVPPPIPVPPEPQPPTPVPPGPKPGTVVIEMPMPEGASAAKKIRLEFIP